MTDEARSGRRRRRLIDALLVLLFWVTPAAIYAMSPGDLHCPPPGQPIPPHLASACARFSP